MELVRNIWNKENMVEFQKYMKTFEDPKKKEWCTNILQTSLPVLCMKTPDIKKIVDEIYKGNFLEFLNFMEWEYYENTAINGMLISRIKDFDTMKKYLNIYSAKAENWANCDLLKFNTKGNEEKFFYLSGEYIKSDKPFVRRIGLYILFEFADKEEYTSKIFERMDAFKDEEHYYVNMMNAWLLSEMFIKQRESTLRYIENNNLNRFVINKGIQKCRESRRVSLEDKKMLLKYKV